MQILQPVISDCACRRRQKILTLPQTRACSQTLLYIISGQVLEPHREELRRLQEAAEAADAKPAARGALMRFLQVWLLFHHRWLRMVAYSVALRLDHSARLGL